jgi:hypothetical protein
MGVPTSPEDYEDLSEYKFAKFAATYFQVGFANFWLFYVNEALVHHIIFFRALIRINILDGHSSIPCCPCKLKEINWQPWRYGLPFFVSWATCPSRAITQWRKTRRR